MSKRYKATQRRKRIRETESIRRGQEYDEFMRKVAAHHGYDYREGRMCEPLNTPPGHAIWHGWRPIITG